MIVPFHDDDPDPDTFIQDQKLEQIGVVQRTHNTEIPSGEFVAAHVSVGAPVYAVPSDEDSLYIVEYLNDSGEDYQLRLFIPVTFNVEENDLFFSGQP